MPEPTCDCFAFETCELCYTPPASTPPSPARNIWDLPVFGWAWTEDGRDRHA